MARDAFICDAVRTPIGRYGGVLAGVRTDDLGALPLRALRERNAGVDWSAVDDVYYGCANQAGEDNRNVARISALLAGLPVTVPGVTLNRLCGSGMDAVGSAARAIRCGEASLVLAGGVESMSRAPFVMPKADSAFSREAQIHDTTLGWRFVNPLIKAQYGVDSMPETGENVAAAFGISRADQDLFAWRSQQRAGAAIASGFFAPRDRAGQHRAAPAGAAADRPRRAPAPGHHARGAGEAAHAVSRQRHDHRGQCLGRERRRLRAAAGLGRCREAARADAARARRGDGGGGRGAAHHGHRAGAGDPQGARARGAAARADGRDRAQRGLRGAGPRGDARTWVARRRSRT